MQIKTAKADFKALTQDGNASPTGQVEAMIAAYGNVDLYGEQVFEGAFDDSVIKWVKSGDQIPMIFMHDWKNPMSYIGSWDPSSAVNVKATDKHPAGLALQGQVDINEGNAIADQTYRLMQKRRVKEFSYGFRALPGFKLPGTNGAKVDIHKLDLYEAGPTLKGINEHTALLMTKAVELEASATTGLTDVGTTPEELKAAIQSIQLAILQLAEEMDALRGDEVDEDQTEEIKNAVDEVAGAKSVDDKLLAIEKTDDAVSKAQADMEQKSDEDREVIEVKASDPEADGEDKADTKDDVGETIAEKSITSEYAHARLKLASL